MIFSGLLMNDTESVMVYVKHKDASTGKETPLGVTIISLATAYNSPRMEIDAWYPLNETTGVEEAQGEVRVKMIYFNNSDADMVAYVKFLKPNAETVHANMFQHYFLRKLRSDVIQNGPKITIRKMIYNFETEEEQRLYDYVSGRIDDANDWIQRNRGIIPWRQRGEMIMTLILRQRQAAIHPQLVLNAEKTWAAQMDDRLVVDWDPEKVTKANKIMEMIKQDQLRNRSTMVVTHFKEELALLQTRLNIDGIPVWVLNGKTKPKDRRSLELNVSNIASVVLLQIQAGGVGISLPWIHHVVNASPDWNPFLEKQAIYRAFRITTKHDVDVTSLYFRNTIDIDIQKRQREKMERGAMWLGDNDESIRNFIMMPDV
jgi:SNF2 family DNA or RNA helicase